MVWYHWDEVKEKKMKAKTSWYHLHCKKKTPSPKNEVIKINAMHKTTCTIEYRQLVLNWRNKRFAINHRVWFWWKTVSIEFFLKHPERVLSLHIPYQGTEFVVLMFEKKYYLLQLVGPKKASKVRCRWKASWCSWLGVCCVELRERERKKKGEYKRMMMQKWTFFVGFPPLESNPLLLASIVDVLSKVLLNKTKKLSTTVLNGWCWGWCCPCLFFAPVVWSDLSMTARSQFVSWSMLLLLLSKSRAAALTYIH